MSVKSKIVVAALAALFVLLLMILWGVFVFYGRSPVDPLINQIAALITIVVGLVSAFFGHQSATKPDAAPIAVPVQPAVSGSPIAPTAVASAQPYPANAPVPGMPVMPHGMPIGTGPGVAMP